LLDVIFFPLMTHAGNPSQCQERRLKDGRNASIPRGNALLQNLVYPGGSFPHKAVPWGELNERTSGASFHRILQKIIDLSVGTHRDPTNFRALHIHYMPFSLCVVASC